MPPVKEATGLTFLVWNDRFNRGNARRLAREFARGLFLEVSKPREAGLRSALVPRPDLT
jgi:hypothetical protein